MANMFIVLLKSSKSTKDITYIFLRRVKYHICLFYVKYFIIRRIILFVILTTHSRILMILSRKLDFVNKQCQVGVLGRYDWLQITINSNINKCIVKINLQMIRQHDIAQNGPLPKIIPSCFVVVCYLSVVRSLARAELLLYH